MPAYYRKYGGASVSVTINRFAYAMVSENKGPDVQIASSDYDGLLPLTDSDHLDSYERSARSILRQLGISRGVSAFITAELPPFSGMGVVSGSSIALIWALAELQGRSITRQETASLANEAEASPGSGVADLYSQAFGGLTFVHASDTGVDVENIPLDDDLRLCLEARLMLFFTGRIQRSREAVGEFARAAVRNRANVIAALHEIKAAALSLRNDLLRGQIDGMGEHLDRTWRASRRLTPSRSDPWTDQWHEMAMHAGASGGKPNGGLGLPGFLMFYCQPDRQERVTTALESAGLKRVPVRLETSGASLLLSEPRFKPVSVMSRHVN